MEQNELNGNFQQMNNAQITKLQLQQKQHNERKIMKGELVKKFALKQKNLQAKCDIYMQQHIKKTSQKYTKELDNLDKRHTWELLSFGNLHDAVQNEALKLKQQNERTKMIQDIQNLCSKKQKNWQTKCDIYMQQHIQKNSQKYTKELDNLDKRHTWELLSFGFMPFQESQINQQYQYQNPYSQKQDQQKQPSNNFTNIFFTQKARHQNVQLE